MNTIEKMMNIIQAQFLEIMQDDPEFYQKYNIILSNEQQYIREKDRNPKNIYITVKFMPGSLNFGQNLVPVNFNALGEGNKLDACQRLLLEYAQRFNLCEQIDISAEQSGDGNRYSVKQVYTQPQVMSNFNMSWNEFRSLFFMSGTFLIGKNSVPIKSVTYYESEDAEQGSQIDFINTSWDFSVQLDSQAFYGTDSRTKSESKVATLALSLAIYVMDTPLCNKILGIAWNNKTKAPNGIKEAFWLKVEFANDFTTDRMRFKLVHATSPQNLGEFPMMSITFTN